MKRHLIIYTGLLGLIFGLASCSNDETESLEAKNKNVITFDIQHPAIAQTRETYQSVITVHSGSLPKPFTGMTANMTHTDTIPTQPRFHP